MPTPHFNSVVSTSLVIKMVAIFFCNENIYMAKSLLTNGSKFSTGVNNCKGLQIIHVSKLRTFETQCHKTIECDFF